MIIHLLKALLKCLLKKFFRIHELLTLIMFNRNSQFVIII